MVIYREIVKKKKGETFRYSYFDELIRLSNSGVGLQIFNPYVMLVYVIFSFHCFCYKSDSWWILAVIPDFWK